MLPYLHLLSNPLQIVDCKYLSQKASMCLYPDSPLLPQYFHIQDTWLQKPSSFRVTLLQIPKKSDADHRSLGLF